MTTSIYDSIGGAPAVTAAVDIFYGRVLDDAALVPYFEGVEMGRLKGHQRAFITAAIGGPGLYEGRGMAEAHAGLGVTDAAFTKVVEHLVATLTELGVPDDIIGAIGSALSPLQAQIVTEAAVP